MRIGIDGFAMQDPASAERRIGRYARDLARALFKAGPDDEFVMYAVDAYMTSGLPLASNARMRLIPATGRANRFTSRALDSAIYGNPDELDALLILSPLQSHVEVPCGIPRVLSVVYDLIPEILPGGYGQEPAYQEAYEGYLAVLRDYDAILTMSQSTGEDLVRLRGFDPARIKVVGAAANPVFRPATTDAERAEDRERLQTLGIFEPGYILNVGSEDPRKGSRTLARAFSLLPHHAQMSTQLIFAYDVSEAHKEEIRSDTGPLGMPGAVGAAERLHGVDRSPAVHFTGWCDDVMLRALYRNATVMAFPSLYEGFGLPILEAMNCGCPVVAGNNSSQPEVLGNAGVLIDAGDQTSLAGAIASMLESRERRDQSARLGLAQASRFSWSDVAARALATIRGV